MSQLSRGMRRRLVVDCVDVSRARGRLVQCRCKGQQNLGFEALRTSFLRRESRSNPLRLGFV
jgi:hypothetical protein